MLIKKTNLPTNPHDEMRGKCLSCDTLMECFRYECKLGKAMGEEILIAECPTCKARSKGVHPSGTAVHMVKKGA